MQTLRKTLREKRRALSPTQHQQYAQQLCAQIFKHIDFTSHPKKIALYLCFDNEISTQVVINALKQQNHLIYLPILVGDTLTFALDNTQRYQNRFGIEEPDHQHALNPDEMDIVFTPLVAFDKQANRLGMGGGFYDKSFAFKQQKPATSPVLYGVAFDFQCVDKLDVNPWDVPLAGVFTPECFYQRRL